MYGLRTYATATGRDLHHDALLSQLGIAAFTTASAFIAGRIFPTVTVGKQSDRYPIIEKDAFLRPAQTLRAPGTPPRRVGFTVTSDAYFANNHALATEIPIEDLANADVGFALRENSTKLVTGLLALGLEDRVARLVTSISNLGSGVALAGTAKWSDYANSDPISDVTTGQAFIRKQTGLRANTLVIDEDTLAIVRRHPVLLDHFKYTAGGLLGLAQLAELFSVETILVGQGIKQNAVEGGTSSLTNLWGNNALLCRVEPAITMETATFGLAYRWTPPGVPTAFQVERYPNPDPGAKAEVIAAGYYQDERIVARDLAYLISSTL